MVDFCKGKTNQFKKRLQTVIKNGFILGTELRPVGIVTDYFQLLEQSPGGAPVMLFPQFVSKVVSPGQPRVNVVKGDGSEAIKYDFCRKLLKAILDQPDFSRKHGLDGKYGWHSFRIGSLTAQASKGIPLHLMQQQARHASGVTTLGYVNANESEKAKASAALLEDLEPVVPDITLVMEEAEAEAPIPIAEIMHFQVLIWVEKPCVYLWFTLQIGFQIQSRTILKQGSSMGRLGSLMVSDLLDLLTYLLYQKSNVSYCSSLQLYYQYFFELYATPLF